MAIGKGEGECVVQHASKYGGSAGDHRKNGGSVEERQQIHSGHQASEGPHCQSLIAFQGSEARIRSLVCRGAGCVCSLDHGLI